MKDFANSYAQKEWEFAVTEYVRMKHWIASAFSVEMKEYTACRINSIEKKYPQIKKD